MNYDSKNYKGLISEFCASNELQLFKSSLESFYNSLNGGSLNVLVNSINEMNKANEAMLSRVNGMLKYTIDGYLTEAQIEEVDMESEIDGIAITYKHYIPSYVSDDRVYTSVDTRMMIVNFERKEIFVKDIRKSFEIADKCSKGDRMKVEAKVNTDLMRVDEMIKNRDNYTYVVNQINKYNKNAIKNKTFEKIKCMISKNAQAECLAAYDDILDELRDDAHFMKEELKRDKLYDYMGKCDELIDLQKGLLRRLVELNFEVKYESPQDAIEIVKKPINLNNFYSI